MIAIKIDIKKYLYILLFSTFEFDNLFFNLSFAFRRGLNFLWNFSISSWLRNSSSRWRCISLILLASFFSYISDWQTLSHSTTICFSCIREQTYSFLMRLHLHHSFTFLLHIFCFLHDPGWQISLHRWPHGYWKRNL